MSGYIYILVANG